MDEIHCFASLVEGVQAKTKKCARNVNLLRSNYAVNPHLWRLRLQWVEFPGFGPPPLSCLDEAM